MRSSSANGAATLRTWRIPSSTPTSTMPPAVLANATTVRSNPSGDDRSRLNSRVVLGSAQCVQQVPDSTVELIRRR
jgi:hypothetical protein